MRNAARIRGSLAVVLALVGFLTLVASNGVKEAKRDAESRRAGLVKLIRSRQGEVESLGKQLIQLRTDVAEARRRLSTSSSEEARRLREAQVLAGTTAMSGPGLEVRISAGGKASESDRQALSVHDVDLQLVVNALWAAGAEAIAVNGQRLVATSPIRAAGETITVNFRPLVPPYTLEVIGASKKLFEGSEVAQRFRQWAEAYGLGFAVKQKAKVEVPAFAGRLQLSSARPTDPAQSDPAQADPAQTDPAQTGPPASPGGR